MKKLLLLFIIPIIGFSQKEFVNTFTISGFVSDNNNGESLIGVNIYSDSLNLGTTTNSFGFYSLTLPEGEVDVAFSFIGYSTYNKHINLKKNTELNLPLNTISKVINEVVLTDQISNVKKTQSSVISVPVLQIKSISTFKSLG